MVDPRKPVHTPDEGQQALVRKIVHQHLMTCTAAGAQEIGCSGASFVMLGIAEWVSELAYLDPKATSQMLAALSVLYDPRSNEAQKRRAEEKRRSAVRKLHTAVDIDMATPGGSA